VSTGTSRRPKLNSSTQAAVLRPTPGSAQSAARPEAGGASASQSRLSGSPIVLRICWIRTDLTFEMPPGRIASSTSCADASRTASQLAKRWRKARNATSRLRSLVLCESTVRINSSIGRPCGGAEGMP